MARTTSTQRGASRRTTRSASGGPARSGASASRSRKPPAPARGRTSASRSHKPAGPIIPIALVALLVLLAWALYPALRLQYQASRSLAGIEQQSAALKVRNAALKAQIADLKTPQGVEKAAREALGYAKKGDHAYVVVSGQSTPTASAGISAASVTGPADASLWQLALDALFGVQQPTSTVEP